MKEYKPEVLRKLQLMELDILKDFDALCQKHSLSYLVFYGAGIGALRHGGFIPWDDDIDILMPRADYDRFLDAAKEVEDRYYLMNAEADPNFPNIVTSFCLKGTTLITDNFKSTGGAICIDILPMDYISDDPREEKKQARQAWFWNKLMILRQLPTPNVPFRGTMRKLVEFVCGIIHGGLKLLRVSPKWLYAKCKKVCTRYNAVPTRRMAFLTDTKPGMSVFELDELFPARLISYEGVELPFPKEVEALLTRYYGDYMQLPPEEERRNHFPDLLDFGDGERYQSE